MFGTQKNFNPNNDYEVPKSPSDSISDIAWGHQQDWLVASSWDSKVYLWAVQKSASMGSRPTFNANPQAVNSHNAPVLCVTMSQDNKIFSGGCDNVAKCWPIQSGNQSFDVAKHDAPIKAIHYIDQMQMLMTGSWDKTLRYWDMRQQKMAANLPMPERVYAISAIEELAVVACAQRTILVYDLKNPSKPYQNLTSPLAHQTRCVCCFPDKSGYAIGSIEGRVAIQYIQETPTRKSFAFKCHRNDNDIYAVNSIHFNPVYHSFSTAGSDGSFHFWDKDAKRRLQQFKPADAPITVGKFNRDGTVFGYAVCYDWSKGSSAYKQDYGSHLLLHACTEKEVKTKKQGF